MIHDKPKFSDIVQQWGTIPKLYTSEEQPMRFRFTLRDWLWLVLTLGLAMAWAADHWRLLADMREAEGRMIRMEYGDHR